MKTRLALVLAAALAAAWHGAIAQNAAAPSAAIDGQVIKVDPSAGKITIKHGPAPKLGMDEGMTMIYRAQDPRLLDAVKAGDRIRFGADQINGQYTVTTIQKAK
jgi:Cu(I)/Ag(I) efflux system periplasmic protein CusF